MSNPKVSIIITVYNVEKYIKKCLDSIVAQTYSNLEIIVVIDGSTDNSETIIRDTYGNESGLRIINQPNGGLSAARNTGLKESTGEFILFVDGDDWIKENSIEKLISIAEKDNSDVVIYNMCYVYPDGTTSKRIPHIEENQIIDAEEALLRELLGVEYKFHAPNKFCRRGLFIDNHIEFPYGRLYEDMATTYKILAKSNVISLIDDSLYFYLQKRNDSITGSVVSEKMFQDLLLSIDEILEFFKDKRDVYFSEAKQAFYVENIISFCNYLYKADKRTRAFYIDELHSSKHWSLMRGVFKNSQMSIERKIRGFMINNCWAGYCVIMRRLKG